MMLEGFFCQKQWLIKYYFMRLPSFSSKRLTYDC